MSSNYPSRISSILNLPLKSVSNTLRLLEEGATIPFISRYRKEATGSLDEVQVSEIKNEWQKLKDLDKRRESILNSIEEQGKLTDALRSRIEMADNLTRLEDLYLPYKRKRRTRATMAREKGLEPLAETLFKQDNSNPFALAKKFLSEEVQNEEEALQGARDIIAEWINEDEKARNKVRYAFANHATIRTKVVKSKEKEASKYKDYFDFEEALKKCPSHRILAMRRGEEEGFLRLSITADEERTLHTLNRLFLKANGPSSKQVALALEDCYKRLLSPSIETEFRNASKEKADVEAIEVFTKNLKQLLLSPPLGEKRILALDPGFRTGCKVVCLDEAGRLLHHTTIFPHPPQSESKRAAQHINDLVRQYHINAIAAGNGTASRETMSFLKNISFPFPIDIFLVSESGASIYSASEVAREEFPNQDVTVRGAISIGRRLMDPLAELVKIDPKSIGVGQYQHDVNQTRLKESLDQVVESCVNAVGINLNTASKHLLTYVSGLGPVLARNIVDYRDKNGMFPSRKALKNVDRMGAKAFEQSAGFLRIRESENPLDNTGVHPESYPIVAKMARDLNCSIPELIASETKRKTIKLQDYITPTAGLPTLKDIMKELAKPGLDPRGKAKSFEFANTIHTIEDVSPGMILPGIITNVTNFGAFVDIGIKESGLVHISELANKFVKSPGEVVSLNQEVKVKVLEVDLERKRVQLSIKRAFSDDSEQ